MNELEQQIKDLKEQETTFLAQLVTAETEVEERALTNELNIVRNKLSEKELELKALQEKEQEVQKVTQAQEEHNGGLKEVIRQIFGAVCPSNLAEAVGLTEYGEMLQTFNQLVEEAVDGNNAVLYNMIGQQLEAKDAKLQEITTKNIGLESNLQTAIGQAEQLRGENANLKLNYKILEDEKSGLALENGYLQENVESKQREIDGLQTVIATKDEEIHRLREELNRAPASRQDAIDITPTYKASSSLQDKIAESGNKIMSSIEIAMQGRQFRGPVKKDGEYANPEAPAIFGTEAFDANTQDNQLHTSEVAENVEGGSFLRDTTEQQSDRTDVDGEDVEHGGTQATLEERVAKLEAAVFGWQAVA